MKPAYNTGLAVCNVAMQALPFETGLASIEKIFRLESEILKMPQVALPLRHYFAKGMYAREMFIPKGVVLTGAIHRTQHMSVISQGDISVMTENGVKRLTAPHLLISEPGMKRAGYAHEDTVWTTFHVTDETDIEKLEAELVHNDYELLLTQRNELEGLCLSE